VQALARAEGLALHDVWEVDAAHPPGATLAQWADAWRQQRQGAVTRALFALRWGLGRVLGLDRGSSGFSAVYAEPEEQLHRITVSRRRVALTSPSWRDRPNGEGGRRSAWASSGGIRRGDPPGRSRPRRLSGRAEATAAG
jgi:hypothetical protein